MQPSRRRSRRGLRRVAAVAGATALAGVFGLASPAAASDPGILQDHQIAIEGFAFDPPDLEIAAGESVEWTNLDDGVNHTVTHDASGVGSPILATGDTWEMLFTLPIDEPITYHCEIHPSMTGTITVG